MTKIVAEIGCNHRGDIDTALHMIDVAAACGVNYVKFQKRNPRELLTEKQFNAPHPNPANSYGVTYGEHREFLEFSFEEHRLLKRAAEDEGVGYACSVWDMTSAREIASLNPDYIKIPSAMNTHFEMLTWLRENSTAQLHVSMGMTTDREKAQIIHTLGQDDWVPYVCTSAYPARFEDLRIDDISEWTGEVGFSGHHLGIAIDIGAVALGASWVERHFTMDRTWKGTDHAASLEPAGLQKLVRDIRAFEQARGSKHGNILPCEVEQREKLKWKP